MIPSNRKEFTNYCLRKLGKGVIEINIDPDQVDDRIDEALDFWRNFHHDSVERMFLQHQITQTDIDNKYITMNDNIMGITRIFPPSGSSGSGNINMFDLRYQIRLNDFHSFYVGTNTHLDYYLIRRQLEMIDMFYVGEPGMQFNRLSGRIYLYWDWDSDIQEGEYIILECEVALDPDVHTRMWSDRMLQRYAVALLKQQWAQNLSKYQNVQLLGGIMMNGQEMYVQATQEIAELEEQIRETFQVPPHFITG